jgi:sec-independent protein translocase protein TatC
VTGTLGRAPLRRRLRRRGQPVDPQGHMPLMAHLGELRTRLVKSSLAILAGGVVGFVFYQQIFTLLQLPIEPIIEQARREGREVELTFTDITGAFTFQIRVALYAGVVLAAPVWLYQLWSFVVPGLERRERRYSYLFMATAVPLFAAGLFLAFLLLPTALELLIGFTPQEVSNLVRVDTYLQFVLRLLLVFGVAFELPVFLVMLNLIGVLSSAKLRSSWRMIMFGIFIFAAVASPTADALSMMFLAVPMLLLFGLSVLITSAVDRRRAARSEEPDYGDLDDDEISPLADHAGGSDDGRPSPLDADRPDSVDDDGRSRSDDGRPSPGG